MTPNKCPRQDDIAISAVAAVLDDLSYRFHLPPVSLPHYK